MKLSDAEHASLLFVEQGSDPATPATGLWRAYFKAGGFFIIDDGGAVSGPFTAGGYSPGGTDVAVADGGTGASTAAGARTNLGLVIGTDVQAFDADLADIAGIADAQGDIIIRGASGWERLAKSATATDVLTAGASQPAWAAPSGGGGGGVLGASTVLTSEATTASSYTGLTTAHTASPVVPASGQIVVMVTVDITCNTTTTSRVSFALSGANTLAASDNYSIRSELSTNFVQTMTMAVLLTGLTPGSTTVTVQCKCSGGNTVTLSKRHLIILAA